MQRRGNYRSWRCRPIDFIFYIPAVLFFLFPCVAFANDIDEPIPFSCKNDLIKKDDPVCATLKQKPWSTRNIVVDDVPLSSLKYFFKRPLVAHKISKLLGTSSISLYKAEDAEEWDMTGKSGAIYIFKNISNTDESFLLRFSYFYRAPVGIGIKLSGTGAVAGRIRENKKEKAFYIDYDIYFTAGKLPLDSPAKIIKIHEIWIQDDFTAIARAFTELLLDVADDPEDIADEMETADDLFNQNEIDSFQATLLN